MPLQNAELCEHDEIQLADIFLQFYFVYTRNLSS